MPTPDLTTYKVVHDLSRGNQLGTADAIEGYTSRIPDPLYAGDSFSLELLVYEKYSATAPVYCDWPNNSSPAATTAKLYIKHADTIEDPVLVADGVISAYGSTGKRCVATFTVYAGDLPAVVSAAAGLTITLNLYNDQDCGKYHSLDGFEGSLYGVPVGSPALGDLAQPDLPQGRRWHRYLQQESPTVGHPSLFVFR